MAYVAVIQPYQMNGYRETEAMSFYRDNKVVTPVRITSFNAMGGAKQPVIVKNFLQTENVGKSPNEHPVLDVYVPGSYQLG